MYPVFFVKQRNIIIAVIRNIGRCWSVCRSANHPVEPWLAGQFVVCLLPVCIMIGHINTARKNIRQKVVINYCSFHPSNGFHGLISCDFVSIRIIPGTRYKRTID
ncbi:unnamed protein product [Laminaria digitata]